MRAKRGFRLLRTLLGSSRRRAPKRPEMDAVELTFRHIWHRLLHAYGRKAFKRRRPNVLVVQMGKVASYAICAALRERGINAFHSHGFSSAMQHAALARILDEDLTFRLAAHELRGHIQNVGLHALTRWYQKYQAYEGHRLKVITLARDPVTRYPSSLVHRIEDTKARIAAWDRARLGLQENEPLGEQELTRDFILEMASIIAEARPSQNGQAHHRCLALARERWPEHPMFATELAHWLAPLTWFQSEITSVFGLDMLALPDLRERGWAEWSNDWVDVLALKYEELPSLVPQIARFTGVADLVLPRRNVTSDKPGAAMVAAAMKDVMETPVGQDCARELRLSSYGRAWGYDRLAAQHH